MTDPKVDPEKGTGANAAHLVIKQISIGGAHTHEPLIQLINKKENLTEAGGNFAYLSIYKAREEITRSLSENEYLLRHEKINHSLDTYERCDTPVEYISTPQWFVRIMDQKEEILTQVIR